MKSLSFLLNRLAWSVFVLFGLSLLIFFVARVIPGNPARMALGPRVPQEIVDNFIKELHLDDPLYVQYLIWLKGVLHGDFGVSLLTRRQVLDDIKQFFPATIELILLAGIIETILGILLGVLSAWFSRSWFDGLVRLVAYLGVVVPAFVWAIIFMLVFGYLWPILPILGRIDASITVPATRTGFMTIDSLLAGNYEAFKSACMHLILPSIALSMGGMSQNARITRSSMLENLNKDYVGSEIVAGIPMRVVLLKYVLKPSIIPTINIIALDIAAMIGNAFMVEMVFNYPGLSRYGVNVILSKDLNAITAVIMIIGLTFVIMNFLVDLIVAWLDPRIIL